jgi:hypothetical protein
LSRKKHLRKQCLIQEQKLEEDFSHIRENAGSLLLSGFTGLLFSGPKTAKKTNASALPATAVSGQPDPFKLANILSIGKELLPAAWEIARPLIFAWGIKKITNLILKPKPLRK